MIYLVCHSGFLNYGDELIARTWMELLRKKYPHEKICVDTCDPGLAALLHGQDNGIIFTDTLWRLARSCAGKSTNYVFDLEYFRDPGSAGEIGLNHLKQAHTVHLVGGGYLNLDCHPNYSIPLVLSKLKEEVGFKLFATGLGLEPVEPGLRSVVGRFFTNFDWVDVRDQESYSLLKDYSRNPRISLSPDDAFLARFSSMPRRTDGKLILIAQLDSVSDAANDAVLPFLLKLIDVCPFAANGVEVVVLDATADLGLANRLKNLSGRAVDDIRHVDLLKDGLPISAGDFVFTTRFHGHLVASLLGCYGLCASVRLPYYDIKHRSLIELGSGFDLIGMHDFDFEGYDWHRQASTFSTSADRHYKSKMEIVDQLYS